MNDTQHCPLCGRRRLTPGQAFVERVIEGFEAWYATLPTQPETVAVDVPPPTLSESHDNPMKSSHAET